MDDGIRTDVDRDVLCPLSTIKEQQVSWFQIPRRRGMADRGLLMGGPWKPDVMLGEHPPNEPGTIERARRGPPKAIRDAQITPRRGHDRRAVHDAGYLDRGHCRVRTPRGGGLGVSLAGEEERKGSGGEEMMGTTTM